MKKSFFSLLFILLFLSISTAQSPKSSLLIIEIKDEIDVRTVRYLKLALEQAKKIQATALILEIDTYGGVMTDAKAMVDLIMSVKQPTLAFINSDAASAGALIAIACDSIYMKPGASIGAATVVLGDGKQAPDKYQSYMRSVMRSTAEVNHRNPIIAEGMVDDRLVIEGIKEEGKVITFTTTEAIKNGYCEAAVESVDEIIKRNQIVYYETQRFQLATADRIISIFLNPFLSGLLILVIIGGIYFELQTPGVGFPLLAAITALVLYLVPYYLNGLAQYWEIIVLFIGILLLLAEIFLIPGFGIAGILGISLTILSMILIMLNNDFFNFDFVPMRHIVKSTFAILGGVFGGILLLLLVSDKLTGTSFFHRLVLTETQNSNRGFSVNTITENKIGQVGKTRTILRPSGKIILDGKVYDAFSQGEFIEEGETVEVISTEGITLCVKKHTNSTSVS